MALSSYSTAWLSEYDKRPMHFSYFNDVMGQAFLKHTTGLIILAMLLHLPASGTLIIRLSYDLDWLYIHSLDSDS